MFIDYLEFLSKILNFFYNVKTSFSEKGGYF